MTYETVRSLAAMTGLFMFITLFAGVLIYVLWPGNSARFEQARRMPLADDPDEVSSRGANGS
jgi:cytochrome c oxidase cbb3-type subunit IV